jgi:hypothetical protein
MPNSILASGRSTSYDRALDTAGVGSAAAVAVATYDTANDGATYQPTVRAKGSPLQARANYSMADPIQDGALPTAAAAYHAAGSGADGMDGGRAAATAPPHAAYDIGAPSHAAYDIGAPSSAHGTIGHATYNAAGSATATGEAIYDEADNDFKSNEFLVEGSGLKVTSVRRANPLYRQSTFENLGEMPETGVSTEENA